MSQHMTCDRCHKQFEGDRTQEFTSGYYDTSGASWNQFACADEKVVCDSCMWANPGYIAVYGRHV